MSFDYNPYKHIEIVMTDDKMPKVVWHCHSCGGDSKTEFPIGIGVARLFADYYRHLLNSHNRTPEDFATWSKY